MAGDQFATAALTAAPDPAGRIGCAVAARMDEIEPFHALEVLTRATALAEQGRSIVSLAVGEPDFPTPQPIVDAAAASLRGGRVPYTHALGLPALREAIAGFYRRRLGVDVDPGRIVVTAGASAALMLTMGVLADPGDEFLMPDPGYPCNRQFVRVMGGIPRALPVGPGDAYQPDPGQVRSAWGTSTRGVVLASPSNPCGSLIPRDALQAIAEEVRTRRGTLVVDEIYLGLTYGQAPRSALELGDDLFVVSSFSKYFQMTGWRLGWLVAPPGMVREIEKLAQNLYIAPSTIAQHAALAAFDDATIALLEERREEFHRRRDFLVPELKRIGFRVPRMPEGAFYVYADCSALAPDSMAFAMEVLEGAGVAITPGRDFGSHGAERHVRFTYASSIDTLREAVTRIERWLAR